MAARTVIYPAARQGPAAVAGHADADVSVAETAGAAIWRVIRATTDLPVDDELATLAAREKIGVFRGSESDLVARYVGAAEQFGLDTVARVTGDCPFVDAELVDWCLGRIRGVRPF